MSAKVADVHERKALYMSDLRKAGRIPVTYHGVFKSVKRRDRDHWVVEVVWLGERRYLELDSEGDRTSFLRLDRGIELEIESIGQVGVDKIAIYHRGIRVDIYAEPGDRPCGTTNTDQRQARCATVPLALERTTIDQVCAVYEKIYPKALGMVERLDPNGEQGLTADKIVQSVLTAYALANQFVPRLAKCPPDESRITAPSSSTSSA